MLNYNEIKEKKYIVFNEEPYEVLSSNVFRKQQGKPVNQTKMRNLKNGNTVEHTFHQSDKVKEIDLEKKTIIYLFTHPKNDEIWFSEENDKSKRFTIPKSISADVPHFIKENNPVETLMFNGEVIKIKFPIKINLEVQEAPPAVRGNTAQGAVKTVILETGFSVNTPLFIDKGDIIIINTETREYVGRAEKK